MPPAAVPWQAGAGLQRARGLAGPAGEDGSLPRYSISSRKASRARRTRSTSEAME
jgi:hypothetical protein